MFQIFLNYLTLIIIPALIGVIARLAFMKQRKGYIVPIIFVCISVVMCICAVLNYGSGEHALDYLAFSSLIATGACLVCGGIIKSVKIIGRVKNKQQ